MRTTRVLLADNHQIVRTGLRMLVDAHRDLEIVGEAGDGREAVRLATELRPDVVVLDVSMPRMNGLDAAEILRAACPEVKVLALTRHTDETFLNRMLAAGVAGYLLKQSAPDELPRAIRALAAGETYLDPVLAGILTRSIVRAPKDDRVRVLTARETSVLRLSARGMINKEVAAALGITLKTVEAHKANGMRKLELADRAALVRYAANRGWLRDV